jgi:hypothetical protein
MSRPLVLVEVERDIARLCDALEAETETYAQVSELAARCEADYKLKFARAVMAISATTAKMPVAEKEARAEVSSAEELRAWKLAEARRQATKEALLSIRARLDALRSLNASVRSQT